MEYIVLNGELYHHGILGQKWGKRNGPPYPLKESDHSAAEKKAGWSKSLDKPAKQSAIESNGQKSVEHILRDQGNEKLHSQPKMNAKKLLNLSDADYEKVKKFAKIAGIGLGTAAGIYTMSCLLGSQDGRELLTKIPNDLTQAEFSQVLHHRLNHDKTHPEAFDLDDGLFHNDSNDGGDYVGDRARAAGCSEIDSEFIKNAVSERLNSSSRSELEYDLLTTEVRKNVEVRYDEAWKKDRRLSCWSASMAYYLSVLTGKDFVSKNFQNAVDFNKLGKLFNEDQTIFDLFGNKTSSYVGTFGSSGTPVKREMANSLIGSILKNVGKDTNLSPDGSRTVGFINAAHNSFGCPHQWNFEIVYGKLGKKELKMVDGYNGTRYSVAKMTQFGRIKFDPMNLDRFWNDIKDYNDDSIRFYAPRLEALDSEMVAKVVLGKA